MKVSITFLLISVLSYGIGNGDFDHNNKRHLKEILKVFGESEFELVELIIPDSMRNNISLSGKFFEIITNTGRKGFSYVGRVNTCRAGGCSLTSGSDAIEFEYFDYFILYGISLEVKSVRIFNYQATHGHEITAKNWLKQFYGYDGSYEMEVGKNIDSISGATMSVYSITYDVENVSEILGKLSIM